MRSLWSRLGVLLVGWFALASTAGAWAAESETATPRPNILFCISDDQSYPHTSAYGCSWVTTPGFDRVAEHGLLFRRAYTPDAKCAPSRSSILTGRNPWQLEAAANHVPFFPAKFKVFTEALAENGYFVGSTGKTWSPGIAKTEDGQPRPMTGRKYQKRSTKPPARGISNIDYAANFADFLADAPEDGPWCFWYGATEPHRGYEYGSGVAKGGHSLDEIDRVPAFWPDTEVVRNDMLDYGFEIEHFDSHLVRMLDMLEKRGELENTLVVVTSDNGMPFPRVKGQEYELSNHLPLAIMWPKGIKNPGRAIDDYVSFVDFAPTFLEVAGVEWDKSGMASTAGRSLTEVFTSEKAGQVVPERNFVLVGKERHDIGRPGDGGYPIRGLVQDGWLYLHNYEPDRWPAGNPETGYLNTDGGATKTLVLELRREEKNDRYWQLCFGRRPAEELFQTTADPDCLNNLAGSADHAERQSSMRSAMEKMLADQGDPRIQGQGAIFATYPYAQEATRNFYERYMAGEKVRAGWVNDSDFESGPID
jgi:arylsulfatase A-like enzyme